MNKLVSPLISSNCGLITRFMAVTKTYKPRTPEWHENTGDRVVQNESLIKSLKTQQKMLETRLQQKTTITAFQLLLVEKKLKDKIDAMQKENQLDKDLKKRQQDFHYSDWKRLRPGNSKYSHWQFKIPRRTCYRPEKRRYVKSACPVCRDSWYPTYQDVEKLKDYIDPKTNRLIPRTVTNVCGYKHNALQEAVTVAQSKGLLMPANHGKPLKWTSAQIYGKDRTEVYGTRERYNKSYRHLPGNIWYQTDNEFWDHKPIERTEPDFKFQ